MAGVLRQTLTLGFSLHERDLAGAGCPRTQHEV